MNYQNHLYMILHPNCSLVGSQYSPEDFAAHYMSGSTRHYDGKVVFAEIDINYRQEFFNIDRGIEGLVEHEDGRPKATKFICAYRVLEHVSFDAVQRLYVTTPSAVVLGLDPEPYDVKHTSGFIRIFAEISPVRMLVLTRMSFPEFGKAITDPNNPKGAPSIFYTQIDLNIADFLGEIDKNPFLPTPIPSVHPSKLRDAIIALQSMPDKRTKGLSLDSNLNMKSYRSIRHGFMFASQSDSKFFRMPSPEEIEDTNHRFAREM
ncbi:MAG: hypothetical protein V3S41_06640 [Spirochaetia bacterium]